MKSCHVVIRVIGYVDDITGTIILEETNKGNYEEAVSFIISHPHKGITWKIKPIINDLFIV